MCSNPKNNELIKMIKIIKKVGDNMLTINWKQIYECNLYDNKQWILILYDI